MVSTISSFTTGIKLSIKELKKVGIGLTIIKKGVEELKIIVSFLSLHNNQNKVNTG